VNLGGGRGCGRMVIAPLLFAMELSDNVVAGVAGDVSAVSPFAIGWAMVLLGTLVGFTRRQR
jgi:hypothetical protein